MESSIGWRAKARQFAESELAPLAEQVDRDDRLPERVRQGLASAGFMGLGVPAEYGGMGGDTRSTVAVLEEISAQSPAAATLLSVHLSVCSAPILRFGTSEQRRHYLPRLAAGAWLGAFALTEPGAGSDAAHISTRYRKEDGDYVLDGAKMFITNAASADVVLAFATRDARLGPRGITAFLLEKGLPGFGVARQLDKLGLRGSETAEIILQNVRLDEAHRLGAEGEGLRIALGSLTGGRVGIASCALGVARAAFEVMCAAAKESDADWKREIIAEAYARLEAARALIERAAELKDSGQPFALAASAAKLEASGCATWIAERGIDLVGRAGATSRHRAERLFRDARVFPIVEGTTEVQRLILARSILDGGASE